MSALGPRYSQEEPFDLIEQWVQLDVMTARRPPSEEWVRERTAALRRVALGCISRSEWKDYRRHIMKMIAKLDRTLREEAVAGMSAAA